MMTFEQAVQLARDCMDHFSRRLVVIAVGTFGKETGAWGVSVYIDGNKEHRKVLWQREDLAGFGGELVRLCQCGEKRELHVELCKCGSAQFEVCQRSYSPMKKSQSSSRGCVGWHVVLIGTKSMKRESKARR